MRTIAAVTALLSVLFYPLLHSQEIEPTRVQSSTVETMRPEIVGARGIVAGGRHYSVAAGVRILQQGGNAIDAGVATVFAAAVVEISHFGLGGEVPIIIYDAKTKKVRLRVVGSVLAWSSMTIAAASARGRSGATATTCRSRPKSSP